MKEGRTDIMKEYIRQLILESYENENISLEEASMLMECVDEYVLLFLMVVGI